MHLDFYGFLFDFTYSAVLVTYTCSVKPDFKAVWVFFFLSCFVTLQLGFLHSGKFGHYHILEQFYVRDYVSGLLLGWYGYIRCKFQEGGLSS